MKFYDSEDCVDNNTPSKFSLWVEKDGYMYSIWENGKIGMPHTEKVTEERLRMWMVKEVSPEYVMRFFENARLSLDDLRIAYEDML